MDKRTLEIFGLMRKYQLEKPLVEMYYDGFGWLLLQYCLWEAQGYKDFIFEWGKNGKYLPELRLENRLD